MFQRTAPIDESETALHAPGDTITVLHVDDDPEFGDLVKCYLERESDRLAVRTERGAEEALAVLGDGDARVDCVVSDYDMGATNGVELLRTVRAERPELPFILFTGKGSEAVARDALRAGATDYLQKQSGAEQYSLLANRVQNAVERHRTEQSEQLLLELAEHTNQILFVFTADWSELLFINEAYEDVWGQPVEVLASDSLAFLDRIYPDHRQRVRDAMEQISAGESTVVEYRVNPDEDYGRRVRVRGVPITDETGEVLRVAGFASEITAIERSERSLAGAQTVFGEAEDALYLVEVTGDRFEVRPVDGVRDEFIDCLPDDVSPQGPGPTA